MMCFNPKLSPNFVTPFRDFAVLCCFSLRCFDFTNGSKRVARVRSTSSRDGRFYQKQTELPNELMRPVEVLIVSLPTRARRTAPDKISLL